MELKRELMELKRPFDKFIDYNRFPHLWCPGCGNGISLKAISQALKELDLELNDVILCSGIGCSGRIGDYVQCHRFQGTHGRTLAFATGLKLAQKDKTILAIMGDGDCGAIGGNHLIHSARRNIDITAIVINNFNYGMTGGQYSATTPENFKTTTSPLGKFEPEEDLCKLAQVSGANFVARASVTKYTALVKVIKKGIEKKGFSFIEILSPCPTHFGKNNGMSKPIENYNWLDAGEFPLGEIWEADREDFYNRYWKNWQK